MWEHFSSTQGIDNKLLYSYYHVEYNNSIFEGPGRGFTVVAW